MNIERPTSNIEWKKMKEEMNIEHPHWFFYSIFKII